MFNNRYQPSSLQNNPQAQVNLEQVLAVQQEQDHNQVSNDENGGEDMEEDDYDLPLSLLWFFSGPTMQWTPYSTKLSVTQPH